MNPPIILASAWKECLDSRCREGNFKENNGLPDMSTLTLDFPEAEVAAIWKSRVHPCGEDGNFWNNILYNFRQQILIK